MCSLWPDCRTAYSARAGGEKAAIRTMAAKIATIAGGIRDPNNFSDFDIGRFTRLILPQRIIIYCDGDSAFIVGESLTPAGQFQLRHAVSHHNRNACVFEHLDVV